jgi:hypothetical protein
MGTINNKIIHSYFIKSGHVEVLSEVTGLMHHGEVEGEGQRFGTNRRRHFRTEERRVLRLPMCF